MSIEERAGTWAMAFSTGGEGTGTWAMAFSTGGEGGRGGI